MKSKGDLEREVRALNEAIIAGDVDTVTSLLNEGSSIRGLGFGYSSPLYVAISHGKTQMIDLLLASGLDVNAPLDLGGAVALPEGRRPLFWAADTGQLEAVCTLLLHGAMIDAVDNYGLSALYAAALSIANDSLNVKDKANWLRFQNQKPTGKVAVIEELMLAGADVNLCPKKGWYSPAHFIRRAGIDRLTRMLAGRETKPKGWFW